MLKGLMPVVYSYIFGNLLRALPMAAKQPLGEARTVCLILPIRWKTGADPILKPTGVSALAA
eukprot:5162369-Lingulodinium_polyedra.AAC.1